MQHAVAAVVASAVGVQSAVGLPYVMSRHTYVTSVARTGNAYKRVLPHSSRKKSRKVGVCIVLAGSGSAETDPAVHTAVKERVENWGLHCPGGFRLGGNRSRSYLLVFATMTLQSTRHGQLPGSNLLSRVCTRGLTSVKNRTKSLYRERSGSHASSEDLRYHITSGPETWQRELSEQQHLNPPRL